MTKRTENCAICDAPLVGLQKRDWRDYLHTCSEECHRKWAGKTWPKEEDCPCCPSHIDGPHKFSCAAYGARVIKFPVTIK